jgi:hypothetical protein
MSNLKSYGVYPFKFVNGILQLDKEGNPVLDTKTKTVRIDALTARTLNKNKFSYGRVYLLKETPVEIEPINPKVEAPVEEATITIPEKEVNYEKMTDDELKEISKEKGIKGYQLMKRDTLIKKLQ